MRKNKLFKSLCLALACASALPLFVSGCTTEEEPKEEGKQEISSGTYVLNDFSTPSHLYQMFPSTNYVFGTASFNEDEAFALSGNTSAKLQPNLTVSGEPVVKQRLISKSLGYNYSDLNKVKKIETRIYNTTDTALIVAAELEFSDGAKSSREKTTLTPKAWTTVTYKIIPSLLSMRFKLDKGMYVNYYFEKSKTETNPVLYMDDTTITYTELESEPIEMTLEKDEFCSFDKNYQAYVSYLWGWDNYNAAVPEMGLCADPQYTYTGEGCSYKVRTVRGEQRWNHWYYLKFSESYCLKAGLNKVKPGDKFQYRIYNGGPADSFGPEFYTRVVSETLGTVSLMINYNYGVEEYIDGKKNPDYIRHSLNAYDWNTIEIDFARLEEKGKQQALDKYGVEDADILGNLYMVDFAWGEFVDCEEKIYYFDEMKFIRGENNG